MTYKIKSEDVPESFLYRLLGCRALLLALAVDATVNAVKTEALESVADLLDYITKDLEEVLCTAEPTQEEK